MNILAEFKQYLQAGFYPYFLESNSETYLQKLHNSISKVIYEDILTTFNLNNSATIYIKKLISLVASSTPFTPNIESLSSSLKISKETVYNYLDYLEKSQVFIGLKNDISGLKSIRKADKIYLSNPNLYFALSSNIEIGAVREAFFANQVSAVLPNQLTTSKTVDFVLDKRLFEIGGQSKLNDKNKYPSETFFVLDGIEYGMKGVIPLWLIGFLG
jgi:predicted AAA+ superfamily ATPase